MTAAPQAPTAAVPLVPAMPPPAGDGAGDLLGQIAPWLGALVVLTLIGGVAIYALRRRVGRETTAEAPFTLEELRRLHREGQLTDEEFARAKEAMVAAARRAIDRGTARTDGSGPDRGRRDASPGGRPPTAAP